MVHTLALAEDGRMIAGACTVVRLMDNIVLVSVAAHAPELDGVAAIQRTTATVQRRINPDLLLQV